MNGYAQAQRMGVPDVITQDPFAVWQMWLVEHTAQSRCHKHEVKCKKHYKRSTFHNISKVQYKKICLSIHKSI